MTDITLDPAKGQTLEKWAKAVPADAGIVRLAPGDHGTPYFTGKQRLVQIVGSPGATVRGAQFRNTTNWLFRKVVFEPRGPVGPGNFTAMIDTDTVSSNITFGTKGLGCEFRGCADISTLTVADKLAMVHTLVRLRGRNMVVAFSSIHDCRNAVHLMGPNCRVEDNLIERFTVDAVDLAGSGARVLRNVISDGRHFPEETLHADAIQFQDASASDVVVADNMIEASPQADYLQGITGFDGRWKNVKILGNRVVTSAYHGITMFGVDGVTITGNKVVRERTGKVEPWIQVTKSKDGRASTGVKVANNIAPEVKLF